MPDVAANPGSSWLIVGGCLSVLAALLHIACIFGGPDWYRFFGAGEGMARAAARGDLRPTLITLVITSVLLLWGGLMPFRAPACFRACPCCERGWS